MRKLLCAIALATPVVVFTQAPADSVSPRAKQLHDRAIVVDSHDDTMSKKCGVNEACTTMEGERIDHEAMMKGDLPKVTWEKIVEHIDHAVKTAGVDHVGLGSDFDGATMPLGMEDASKLPKITDALIKKGYSDADIEKILGGNILRVMEQVERVAAGGGRSSSQP